MQSKKPCCDFIMNLYILGVQSNTDIRYVCPSYGTGANNNVNLKEIFYTQLFIKNLVETSPVIIQRHWYRGDIINVKFKDNGKLLTVKE